MSLRIFDEINRTDNGPSLYAEPEFRYLNRSARAEADRVRQVLEEWLSHYPQSEQAELQARLRSEDDPQHRSAFFELCLHELLLRLGCRVEVHPTVGECTARCPDFLVAAPNSDQFYLEAVLATDESEEEAAARARENVVYDCLNRLNSPDFFIGMRLRGHPATPPPARKIRALLERELAKLDSAQVTRDYETGGLDALPHWLFEHDGWRIDFFPIPKTPQARGKPDVRPIGLHAPAGRWLNLGATIRDALLKKMGRYGDLGLPYVVAVNILAISVDEDDLMDALFGQEQYLISVAEDGSREVRPSRAPDGAWISKSGPRYTGVSAVLAVARLSPWSILRAATRLYHNPWAQKPYASVLTRLPQGIPCGNQIRRQEGERLADILDLPLGWPED